MKIREDKKQTGLLALSLRVVHVVLLLGLFFLLVGVDLLLIGHLFGNERLGKLWPDVEQDASL